MRLKGACINTVPGGEGVLKGEWRCSFIVCMVIITTGHQQSTHSPHVSDRGATRQTQADKRGVRVRDNLPIIPTMIDKILCFTSEKKQQLFTV